MTETPPPRLFIFGLGYTARALADRLMAKGWRVAGTTRDEDKAYRLSVAGFEMHLFDRGRSLLDPAKALAGTTHLLSSVAPDERGDPVLDHHGEAIGRLEGLRWAGYLSTTGVYGDTGGAWVDEDSGLAPGQERSRRRAAAERAWWDLARLFGTPIHLFRLAGIYGPGRNLLLDVLRGRARRVIKEGQVSSRIHVADIAGALEASMAAPNPPRFYNLADDEPAMQAEVVEEAAKLLGYPPPPLVPFEEAKASMTPMGLSFWQECRRVSNRRVKEELGYALLYPTYREGLAALLDTLRPGG